MRENAVLKGKLITLNETLANTELETKASRETIMRLVSEVGREQKASTQTSTEIQNLRLVSPCYRLRIHHLVFDWMSMV
jgi:hypothetical protein